MSSTSKDNKITPFKRTEQTSINFVPTDIVLKSLCKAALDELYQASNNSLPTSSISNFNKLVKLIYAQNKANNKYTVPTKNTKL